ncbi:unnamed protein product [Orchesella dallaii]|uniref:Cytochrome P450 4aa1 n=1 Tax=Orchesella dallaii TaxID=48710 RepID=A0ABP1RZJ2_9HEXA
MKIFNRESDRLLTTLEEMYKDGQSKPMEHEMMSFSLNVMTKVALGLRLTEVDKIIGEVPNTDFLSLVNKTKEVMCTRILNPWLLLKPIWRLHPLSNLTEIVSFVGRRVVTESFKWVGNHADDDTRGLQHFLQNSGVEFDGVYEESLTVISAGYETTASSLHFLLFFLALHPNHQEQCRQEIDAVFEDVDFCSNSQSFIHYDALTQLKHLEMCVSETLRLHPNAFLLMRKIEAELELDEDLILPANTNVGIFIPGIHKNPELYPNPEKFIPERFLKEETSNRHSYAYIPFSAGPRKCIGYKFAIMEMMTATAKILRHFHISTSSKLEEVVLLPHITLTPEKPMDFVLTKRKL